MRQFLSYICIVSVLLVFASCAPRDRFVTITGFAQGGTYTVKFNLNGRDGMIHRRPDEIKDTVDAVLARIDASLSGYNRNSLLRRFNEGETILPDSLFINIYSEAHRFYVMTGGVLDVASGPLFDIWGFGFKNGEFPKDSQVAAALERSGMRRLKCDMRSEIASDGTLAPESMLVEPGTSLPVLNYNAIAQGYSCDLVAEYLYSIGVKDMMVDIGEIYCDGHNPSGQPWTIGIDKPSDGNNERGAELQAIFSVPEGPHGVVTSGNYRKFYLKDGKKYAHTIDPRSGYPVSHNLLSATIVAQDGLTADAYATYCMAIGLEKSVEFIQSVPDLEGCLVYDMDGEYRLWISEGFVLK